jgi:hypothetical protein
MARVEITYRAERSVRGAISFNPANCHVKIDGVEIELLQSLRIEVSPDGPPVLNLAMIPDEIIVDADTLAALTLTARGEA